MPIGRDSSGQPVAAGEQQTVYRSNDGDPKNQANSLHAQGHFDATHINGSFSRGPPFFQYDGPFHDRHGKKVVKSTDN